MTPKPLMNYWNCEWQSAEGAELLDVVNPATQELLGRVPLSPAGVVGSAVEAAQAALPAWRQTPPADRAQYLYRMKGLLEAHREELSRLITMECGKTLDESRGEIRRAIENVEVACGIPTLMQGVISEDIAPGIDEMMLRQPVGVCAIIAPFNFPGMIPFWFLPYALACGNTVIVKPSERVPLTMQRVFQILEAAGLPKGVLNLVNGGKARRRCHCWITPRCARSASLAQRLLRATFTAGLQPTASAPSARAAPRTRSWSCRTPTWRRPRASSPTAPSAAPGSAAWRRPLPSRSARLRVPSPRQLRLPRASVWWATAWRTACRWDR